MELGDLPHVVALHGSQTVLRAYEGGDGGEGSARSAEAGPNDEDQDGQHAEPHVEEMD